MKKKEEIMVRSDNDLQTLAMKMEFEYSFMYDSIDDAKKQIRSGIYIVEFDVTTLCLHENNLNYKEVLRLEELLRPFFQAIKDKNREEYKELCERRTLHYFLLCAPESYRKSRIKKEERPDFILSGEKRIGVEITKLTGEFDENLFSAVRQIQEKELKDDEEIKAHLRKYHKKIAEKVEIVHIADMTTLSLGCNCIDPKREHFAKEIKEKHDKYKDYIASFDEFIILCDAASGSGLEISRKEEVDEVINTLLQICPEIIDTTTVIIWREEKHQGKIIYSWYKQVGNSGRPKRGQLDHNPYN